MRPKRLGRGLRGLISSTDKSADDPAQPIIMLTARTADETDPTDMTDPTDETDPTDVPSLPSDVPSRRTPRLFCTLRPRFPARLPSAPRAAAVYLARAPAPARRTRARSTRSSR